MGWLIKNGSYPYLEEVQSETEAFKSPCSVNIWRSRKGSYPENGRLIRTEAFGCFANAAGLQMIRYRGTQSQWAAVQKGPQWQQNVLADSVICADGETPVAE